MQQAERVCIDGVVTLAGAIQETLQVKHTDVSAAVPDKTGLLEGVGDKGHARSSHPQHFREEFLGERKLVAADEIATTQ
jgi:hypothetical protein